jgi:hypothetical protein
MKAYCVKCKAKTDMAGAVESVMENGRKVSKGKCSKCGTGMFKMLATTKAKTEGSPAPAPAEKPRRGPLGVRCDYARRD